VPNIIALLVGIIIILVIAVIALAVAVVVLLRRTRRAVLGLDELAEDALKALYHLSHEKPIVRASDLVRATDLRPNRLSLIVAELVRRGWAQTEGRLGDNALRIMITPPGEKRALELIRAHQLWERYLAEKAGAVHEQSQDHGRFCQQPHDTSDGLGDDGHNFRPEHGAVVPDLDGIGITWRALRRDQILTAKAPGISFAQKGQIRSSVTRVNRAFEICSRGKEIYDVQDWYQVVFGDRHPGAIWWM
jgi:Mn-dependent DtxR family transcriptional regulator